jgi:hypothetical protein
MNRIVRLALCRVFSRSPAPARLLAVTLSVFTLAASAAECRTYPGASWELASGAEQTGWSQEKLKAARDCSATLDTDLFWRQALGAIRSSSYRPSTKSSSFPKTS